MTRTADCIIVEREVTSPGRRDGKGTSSNVLVLISVVMLV